MSCEFLLVVDDEEDVRATIADVLRLDGHHVVAVENGEQAVGAVAVAVPRAIVTDLTMPIRDGESLIARLRDDKRTRGIPVCVVSANSTAPLSGTIAVRKPFALCELRDAVRRALDGGRDDRGAARLHTEPIPRQCVNRTPPDESR